MITMTENYREQAIQKLEKEYKEFKGGRAESVMKERVKKALLSFIEQDNEFARAVFQGDTFSKCMAEIAKKVKGAEGISDLEAFDLAAKFYFAGAKAEFTMKIITNPYEDEKEQPKTEKTAETAPKEEKKRRSLSLSLDDLF